jgi:hypothetical protein
VGPDEKPAVKRKMTVAQAAESGSYKELLIASRDRIAKTVDDPKCPPRDLAALTRRLNDIGKELEAIAVAEQQEDGGAAKTPDEGWEAI